MNFYDVKLRRPKGSGFPVVEEALNGTKPVKVNSNRHGLLRMRRTSPSISPSAAVEVPRRSAVIVHRTRE